MGDRLMEHSVRPDRRRGRRRGAALVIVMIFAVGALMVTTTLLSLCDAGAKVEGSRHRDKTLHFVARHGLATAVNELNRRRTDGASYTDPTGNGFGCILVDPTDGQRGFAVYSSDDPATRRLLGRFTTMVDTSSGRKVLSVVAVDGAFPADMTSAQQLLDRGRLRFTTAEVEILSARLEFDRNAISVRGNAMAGGKNGIHGASNQVYIYGNNVPAVNISDAAAHAEFLETVDGWGELAGLDPETNAAATSRPKTVTNVESGLLRQETLERIAQGIDDRVANVLSTGSPVVATNTALGDGTYYIDTPLVIGSGEVLRGSGTLVINEGVTITGKLEWTGDVIIANTDDAMVKVKGDFNVNGVLAVQGMGDATRMGVTVQSGGSINVGTASTPGAFTLLGSASTQSPIVFENGADGAFVHGIMSIMGNDLNMAFDTGAKMNIQGSLAFVTPEDAAVGLDVRFRNGAHMTVNYTDSKFDGGLTRLGQFYDPTQSILPVTASTWVEDPARRSTLLQQHIEADTGQSYGTE